MVRSVNDVHAMPPRAANLGLERVGVSRVKKPLTVQRPGRVVTLTATFSVSVDLPPDRKGSDLSRNAELLAELVDERLGDPVPSLEALCESIARSLLQKHPSARRSCVTAEADYFLRRGISAERSSFEDYLLIAGAFGERASDGTITSHRSIGAEAVGMTTCPCAMESCRALLEKEYPGLARAEFTEVPVVTHNQRNRTRLFLEPPDDSEVEADTLIGLIEAAQSSPTFAILKRGDEARVVLDAHRRPRFVEDVVRELLASVPAAFPRLPEATKVRAESTSEESIHKYDVVAAHEISLGALRARPSA
ncbi:MAG: GTP cyclohydrolase MptA [Thermoplasmata archaeon]|nr:GTP cyclohydrolase MptA [Thermoplasmata archaeon]